MSDSWWSRKLNNNPAPAQRQSTPHAPMRVPAPIQHQTPLQPQQYQQPQVQQPVPQEEFANLTDYLQRKQYSEIPRKADGQRLTSGVCPSCGSGDYLITPVGGGSHQHCYSCGYPVVQTGSPTGVLGSA